MRKAFFIGLLLGGIIITAQSTVSAGSDSTYGQYAAGGRAPSLLIDKTVAKPTETKGGKVEYNYVDNLASSDFKFSPNQYIFFQVKVKNTSDRELFNITFNDFVPNYMSSAVLEGATYDKNSRVLTKNLGSFAPGEEKVFIVKLRVDTKDKLPADKGVICLVNRAEAKNDEAADDDSTQFCIEKDITPSAQEVTKGGQPAVKAPSPTKIPEAGPEHGILLLTFSTFMGFAGLKLRKFK